MDYKMQKVMFSSMTGHWNTPKDLFDQLDKEFRFHVDVCGDFLHRLRDNLTTWNYNYGLGVTWDNMICYMNPPYGRKIVDWISKAYYEMSRGATTVALLPARTDTNWFWNFCLPQCSRYEDAIRVIKGRLHFSDKGPAPFPSMIVIFRP